MPPPRVFIASASEGLEVATHAHRTLQARLKGRAEVVLWPTEFQLSATYIESLERALAESDFAVLVATGADRTRSRGREQASPRDNVVFETGLFMGRLGRHRCFILRPEGEDLKLPSDLSGVASAGFRAPRGRGWAQALAAPCERMAEQVLALGHRLRLAPEALAAQEAIHLFVRGLAGGWWERVVMHQPRMPLSFIRVEPDPLFSSVTLHGEVYTPEGELGAHWQTQMARVDVGQRTIRYHFTGWNVGAASHVNFHGLGEMQFSSAGAASDSGHAVEGFGRFWDVNESRPERTRVKPVELRRIGDRAVWQTMTRGSPAQRQAAVQQILQTWAMPRAAG